MDSCILKTPQFVENGEVRKNILVRHPKVHHSRISGPRSRQNTAAIGRSLCRECNRERRETHETKSAPSVERGRESTEDNEGNEDADRPFVLLVSKSSSLKNVRPLALG